MRRLGAVLVVALVLAGCGGGSDSSIRGESEDSAEGGSGDSGTGDSGSGDLDPCSLADDAVLASYFGDTEMTGEQGAAGPIVSCSWSDANANSLLIQTATDFDLFRPDPCDGCVDLSVGDDGFAWESPLQSSATVISGSLWLSVTTTGFGDDVASIVDLLETVFASASS